MIRLATHAARRAAERGIAPAWIEATIQAPDWTTPDPDPTLTRSYRVIPERGGRILRVVHRPAGADILVVTAFLDRSARP